MREKDAVRFSDESQRLDILSFWYFLQKIFLLLNLGDILQLGIIAANFKRERKLKKGGLIKRVIG